MSVKQRLNRLEKPTDGDWCPHLPMVVQWPEDKPQNEFTAQVNQQLADEPCWCGLPQLLIVVEYIDMKGGAYDEVESSEENED